MTAAQARRSGKDARPNGSSEVKFGYVSLCRRSFALPEGPRAKVPVLRSSGPYVVLLVRFGVFFGWCEG
jgi:hypothetical protein